MKYRIFIATLLAAGLCQAQTLIDFTMEEHTVANNQTVVLTATSTLDSGITSPKASKATDSAFGTGGGGTQDGEINWSDWTTNNDFLVVEFTVGVGSIVTLADLTMDVSRNGGGAPTAYYAVVVSGTGLDGATLAAATHLDLQDPVISGSAGGSIGQTQSWDLSSVGALAAGSYTIGWGTEAGTGGNVRISDIVVKGTTSSASGPSISLPSSITIANNGTPETIQVTVTNIDGATADLHVTAADVTGLDAAAFTVTTSFPMAAIAPNTSALIDIDVDPTQLPDGLDIEATFNVTSDTGGTPGTVSTVPIDGLMRDPWYESVAAIDLGTIPPSPGTQSFTIDIKNLGANNDLTVDDAYFIGSPPEFTVDDDLPTTPLVVAGSGTGQINLSFDSLGSVGSFTGTLAIVSDDPNQEPTAVSVSVFVERDPEISVPASVVIGPFANGVGPQTFSIQVDNLGAANALLLSPAPDVTDPTYFTVDSFDASIAAASNGFVNLTFDPQGASGPFQTTLQIQSNDADAPLVEVSISATVALPGTTLTFVDVIFPDGTGGTNPVFTEIDNGLNGGGTWDQSTGLITRSSHENSNVSASSTMTFDPTLIGSDSMVLTTIVTNATGLLNSNGIFIGFQTRSNADDPGDWTQLWRNLPQAFGFCIDGDRILKVDSTRNTIGVYSNGTVLADVDATSDFGHLGDLVATQASIDDGFTVVMTINSAGWEFAITGLETSDATPITGGSGIWADVALDFADLSATSHIGFSTQGGDGPVIGSLQLASISLVQTAAAATIRILDTSFDTDTRTFSLTWESQPVATYTLWESPDLSDGSWTLVDDAIASGGAATTVALPGLPGDQTVRFYKISGN